MTFSVTVVDSPPPISTIHLPYEKASPAQARRWARGLLQGFADDETVDAVLICISELVTNSEAHTRPTMDRKEITCRLAVTMGDTVKIRVEVIDAGAPGKAPISRQVDHDDESGRGLSQVVSGYADAWGHEQRSVQGRVTWFEVESA